MANTEENEEETWNLKFREDEEMEFFTELALHETERWIQVSLLINIQVTVDLWTHL